MAKRKPITEVRTCRYCKGPIPQAVHGNGEKKWRESAAKYAKRVYCSQLCWGRHCREKRVAVKS